MDLQVNNRVAPPWDDAEALEIVARHRQMPGATLPILHALQERFGYIGRAAIPMVAEALNLSQAEIHGVVAFYDDFREQPPGRHTLRMCRAEACQSMGCNTLVEQAEKRLGVGLGATTADGKVTLEAAYCLGNCACAPAAMLDGELIGRLDSARLDRLLDRLESAS
ncbi:MAG: formate dehydrogenase subunit gamma [Rhodospirillaceae bacterium]|nr:formate dehydrogenase subunit gamma [Rhodospirillaceae bacterium]